MRFTAGLSVILSEDLGQLERYIDVSKVLDDTLSTEVTPGRVVLAANTANQAFAFNGITNARWVLALVYSGELHIKFNGTGSPAIALKPLPLVSATPVSIYQREPQPGVLCIGPLSLATPITSIHLTNPSATAIAEAFIAVVGEAQ